MRDCCGLIKAISSPKWNPAAPGTHRALVCSWDAFCSLYFVHLRLHRLVVGLTPHCCFEKHALHPWRTTRKKCVLLQSTGFCCSPLSPSAAFYTQELHHAAHLPTSLELGLQPPLWTLVSQRTLHPTQTQTSCVSTEQLKLEFWWSYFSFLALHNPVRVRRLHWSKASERNEYWECWKATRNQGLVSFCMWQVNWTNSPWKKCKWPTNM